MAHGERPEPNDLETTVTKKQLLLWCVLFDFVALTAYTIVTEGYATFVPIAWDFANASFWGLQIIIDFLLAVAIGLGFVFTDARARDINPWPFVALTLTLGSIGLLGYLIHRERVRAPAARLEPATQHA